MQEYDVEDSVLPLQPSLNYTAPELVRNKITTSGSSCDMFSFGCLAYHLIARKPLLDCHNNVKMVRLTKQFLCMLYQFTMMTFIKFIFLLLLFNGVLQFICFILFGQF